MVNIKKRKVIAFQGTIALVTALVFMYMGCKIESSIWRGYLNTQYYSSCKSEQAGEAALEQNVSEAH